MNKIEKLLSNPLAEFLGAERTEDLKDKIAQMILEKAESELDETLQTTWIVDPDYLNEITHEALESIKEKIKQKLEVKCMAIAEEAISKVRVED